MKLIYNGGLPDGTVVCHDGRSVRFERGKPVELPTETASNLLKSNVWEADAARTVTEAPKPPKDI